MCSIVLCLMQSCVLLRLNRVQHVHMQYMSLSMRWVLCSHSALHVFIHIFVRCFLFVGCLFLLNFIIIIIIISMRQQNIGRNICLCLDEFRID